MLFAEQAIAFDIVLPRDLLVRPEADRGLHFVVLHVRIEARE